MLILQFDVVVSLLTFLYSFVLGVVLKLADTTRLCVRSEWDHTLATVYSSLPQFTIWLNTFYVCFFSRNSSSIRYSQTFRMELFTAVEPMWFQINSLNQIHTPNLCYLASYD